MERVVRKVEGEVVGKVEGGCEGRVAGDEQSQERFPATIEVTHREAVFAITSKSEA